MANNKAKNEVKKETAKVETPKAKTFTQDEVNNLVAQAVEKALASVQAQPVLQVAKDEYVTVMFMGVMASDSTVALGKLGNINRTGGTLDIPKKEFLQGLGTPVVDALLKNRSLIVVNGLTDEERERFGLKYTEGELISSTVYYKLLDLTTEEITNVYKNLCEGHKRTVAKLFITAYFEDNDKRVAIDTVKALNKISKEIDKDGLFTPILEDFGKKITEE